MKRKVVLILFFAAVFGLPVCCYLLLQFFGENKFDLPQIARWEHTCVPLEHQALLIVNSAMSVNTPNEKQRILIKLDTSPEVKLVELKFDSCDISGEMYLVDETGWIRGEYDLNREEVDRLMAEIDIYVLNFRNESSTSIQ